MLCTEKKLVEVMGCESALGSVHNDPKRSVVITYLHVNV